MSMMGLDPNALMGGGGAPPGGPPPGGPPPSIQVGGEPPQESQSPEDLISKALDLVDQASKLDPDHEDTLLLEKIQTDLQSYLANQQKMVDSATGAGPGAKLVRKASQGAGGGGGY